MIIVRAAKIVHAGENLLRLISDLKTFLVIHDFPAINETIKRRYEDLNKQVIIKISKYRQFYYLKFRRIIEIS